MAFLRAIRLLVLLAFALEVLNPSTPFVREPVQPSHHQKMEKTAKKTGQVGGIQADLEKSDSPDSPDDDVDYIACSAVIPAPPAPPHLHSIERSSPVLKEGLQETALFFIDRPPARA